MKSIYIAGPMSGYPNFNFDAFFTAQHTLERQGWKVHNPAQKDIEEHPDIAARNPTGDVTQAASEGWDFRKAFKWDCEKVIDGDGIYMLNGWEYSPGATAEHAVAKFVKQNNPDFRIMYQ